MKVPIGTPEGQTLEFKGRDALGAPGRIGAVVVAFLNGEGGDLYVGVRGEAGGAVIEGVEDVEAEIRKLRDFLVDAIEPSPGPDELDLESVDGPGSVLHLGVKRGAHRPYALLGRGGSRSFWVRVGPRGRPMTREELAAGFAVPGSAVDPLAAARRLLVEERDDLQRTGGAWFWVGIQPVPTVSLNVQRPGPRSWLMNPEAIGVPPGSPSFEVPFEPAVRQGRLIARAEESGRVLKETVLRGDGGIRFRSVLHHLLRPGPGVGPRLIKPEVLRDVPLSLFHLARHALLGDLDGGDRLVADLALLGVGREKGGLLPHGWQVPRPGTEARVVQEEDDVTLPEPLGFRFDEVAENSDGCVFRLLRPVYEAFGLREDQLPFSFDPATGLPRIPA